MRIKLTRHAQAQMYDRGIDETEIEKVIKRGSKIKQTDGFKAVYGYIGVCYKIRGDNYIIKTVTLE